MGYYVRFDMKILIWWHSMIRIFSHLHYSLFLLIKFSIINTHMVVYYFNHYSSSYVAKILFCIITRVRNHNSLIWPWKIRRIIRSNNSIWRFLDYKPPWKDSIVAWLVMGHMKFRLWWIVDCVFDSFNLDLDPTLELYNSGHVI